MSTGQQAFREFLNSRERDQHVADWASRKSEWLAELDRLYSRVERWLEPYASDGVSCDRVPTQLVEEELGRYDATCLRIAVADSVAWLEPVGRVIIGARGRVDLRGRWADQRILLVPETSTRPTIRVTRGIGAGSPEPAGQAPYAWKLASDPPNVQYVPLTDSSFFEALLRAVQGDG